MLGVVEVVDFALVEVHSFVLELTAIVWNMGVVAWVQNIGYIAWGKATSAEVDFPCYHKDSLSNLVAKADLEFVDSGLVHYSLVAIDSIVRKD